MNSADVRSLQQSHLVQHGIVEVGCDAPAPQGTHTRHIAEEVILRPVPAVTGYLMRLCERGCQSAGSGRVDGRKVAFAVLHLQCQYQTVSGLLRLPCVQVTGIDGDGDVSSKTPVDLFHHAAEDDTMRRGVFQSRVGNGIVNHLMDEHIVCLLFREFIIS